MDLRTLSPPPAPLTLDSARDWLRTFQRAHPRQGQSEAQWLTDLAACAPREADVAGFAAWLDANGLREPQSKGLALSLRGVSVVVSSDHARLPPDPAWRQAAELLAKVEWLNAAPAELAPLRVADVLMFGSMVDPAAIDHGDMDAFVILEPKASGSQAAAESYLGSHGLGCVLQPIGRAYPSFRRTLLTWLREQQPFLGLDDQPRTLGVLLDHRSDFAAYSLLGRTWDASALAHTTVDEDAEPVMAALANGASCPSVRAHIARRLAQARIAMRLNAPSAPAAWAVASALRTAGANPTVAAWWVGLNEPPSPAALAAVAMEAPSAWNQLRTTAQALWAPHTDPLAVVQQRRWAQAMSALKRPGPRR